MIDFLRTFEPSFPHSKLPPLPHQTFRVFLIARKIVIFLNFFWKCSDFFKIFLIQVKNKYTWYLTIPFPLPSDISRVFVSMLPPPKNLNWKYNNVILHFCRILRFLDVMHLSLRISCSAGLGVSTILTYYCLMS